MLRHDAGIYLHNRLSPAILASFLTVVGIA